MQTSSTNRIAKWDNIKWLMILLVVVGHTIDHFKGSSSAAKSLYFFIYTFHMPVFVFISGLFSKKTVRRKNYLAIYSYLIMYVVMKFTIAAAEYLCRRGEKFPLNLFYDKTPAWYALAMFVFFIVTIRIRRVHPGYLIPASILLSCMVGYSKLMGDHYVSMRIVSFYPFFLMGYFADPARILDLMDRVWVKVLSSVILVLTILLCWTRIDVIYKFMQVLKGMDPYSAMPQVTGMGLHWFFIRLGWYVLAVVMSFCVMSVIPKRKTPFTVLGAGTISVFMWHSLYVRWFFEGLDGDKLLKAAWPTYYVLVAVLIAFVVTLILSQPVFARFTRLITTLPVVDDKKEGRRSRTGRKPNHPAEPGLPAGPSGREGWKIPE